MIDLRIGDAERAAAIERLSAHAAAGRLGVEELERRIERAHAAVFERDLAQIEADLPGRPAPPRRRPRTHPYPPAALAFLLAGLALSVVVGHPVVPLFVGALLLAAHHHRVWT
jgi:hypothetical protein